MPKTCSWCSKDFLPFESRQLDFDMHDECFGQFKGTVLAMVRREYLKKEKKS